MRIRISGSKGWPIKSFSAVVVLWLRKRLVLIAPVLSQHCSFRQCSNRRSRIPVFSQVIENISISDGSVSQLTDNKEQAMEHFLNKQYNA